MTKKVWGGRFREPTEELVNAFNASLRFDARLFPYDIQGSIAHCRMLGRQEILTPQETERIVVGLEQIRRAVESGELPLEGDYEDVHSLVEGVLTERIGSLGKKLHTARSRNDQVALDMRLYVREACERADALLRQAQEALLSLAAEHDDTLMPGYTHLQRAQPVLLAHHLLAYCEMLQRDRERFTQARRRCNVLPLGSAALAGSSFPLDRESVARELGFEAVAANSMDAVSDRDFVLDYLYCAAMVMMHLSRLSEELVLWASQEFGFLSIADSFSTGSSIMPQKKNPDLPELIRGKTGRVYGDLTSLLTTMKGLPLAYNKDMQEDKEVLFDAVDTLEICLQVTAKLLGAVSFNAERLARAADEGFLVATDLADYLVRKGVPFREAHAAVGKLVLTALDTGRELRMLALDEMRALCPQIEEDVYEWLEPRASVNRRNHVGGTGPGSVARQIHRARERLAQ